VDNSEIKAVIRDIILNQRKINFRFSKENGVNKSDLEILAFANAAYLENAPCFSLYKVHRGYIEMNIQQVRRGVKKLVQMGAIERMGEGKKGDPAGYIISKQGTKLIEDYYQSWLKTFYLESN
jgi:hypothetical protein